MKQLFIWIFMMLMLTACPKEQEVQLMMEELMQNKARASELIRNEAFTTEGLLEIQDYFFHIGERVHLLREEPETLKNIQRYIRKKGTASFCEDFVIPVRIWKKLQRYCNAGSEYRCSADMNAYETTFRQMSNAFGAELAKEMGRTSACN